MWPIQVSRCAVDVLHDEAVRANVVARTDVGMIQRRDGAGFAFEAVGELATNDFDGYGTHTSPMAPAPIGARIS